MPGEGVMNDYPPKAGRMRSPKILARERCALLPILQPWVERFGYPTH
jgi:hypothetical protein